MKFHSTSIFKRKIESPNRFGKITASVTGYQYCACVVDVGTMVMWRQVYKGEGKKKNKERERIASIHVCMLR